MCHGTFSASLEICGLILGDESQIVKVHHNQEASLAQLVPVYIIIN